MTDLKQAATLALEQPEQEPVADALGHVGFQEWWDAVADGYEVNDFKKMRRAWNAALKHEAQPVAQPEQEPTCPKCKAAVLYECVACSNNNYPPRPEQEPLATLFGTLPVYDTPPAAQRQWQGLTPEEILDLFDRNNVYGSKWIEFARTVEAKLKEKNNV